MTPGPGGGASTAIDRSASWSQTGARADAASAPVTVVTRSPEAGPPAGVATAYRSRSRRRRNSLFGAPSVPLRMALDLSGAFAGVTVALTVGRSGGQGHDAILALPLAVALMLHLRGMYRQRVQVEVLDGVGTTAGAVSVAAMAILLVEVLLGLPVTAAPVLARAWLFTVAFVLGGRMVVSLAQRDARRRGLVWKPTLIVGAGVVGERIARRLAERPEFGLRPVGFLDADPPRVNGDGRRRLPVLGTPAELSRVVAQTGAEHVILAFSSAPDHTLLQLTRECEALNVKASLVPRLFESMNDRVGIERLGGMPLLGLSALDPKGWQFKVKYALDRPLAAVALLILAPIMVVAAVAVKLSSPGPVLFRQRRVGRDGQTFDLLKFRSMRVAEHEPPSFVLAHDRAPGGVEGVDRRTFVGRLLRRLSIDETPQLFNVLVGQMSLVGPRPERPEYVEMFAHDYNRYGERHRVKSGVTGWAQVHGLRGQTSLSDRIEWDNAYIENWSLALDFKVLVMTLKAMFASAGDA